MMRPARYGWTAPAYDLMSLDWPVYRAGRVAGIGALGLRPGDRVLDLGCGTGLNFALLQDAIGSAGHVVGVDASASMLDQARRRAVRRGWTNVDLVCADATTIDSYTLREAFLRHARPDLPHSVDAVLFTYSLSLMHPWQQAWARALAMVRPAGRAAVVDMGLPQGGAAIFAPVARLACALGGADIHAHPWSAAERDLTQLDRRSVRGGHIQVRAGTVRLG